MPPIAQKKKVMAFSGFVRNDKTETMENIPQPPGYIDGFGRAIWDEVCAFLIREGRFKRVSLPAIASYCVDCHMVDQINEKIMDGDFLIPDKKGAFKKNPLYTLKGQAFTRIEKFEKEYGITPKSRVSIGIKEGDRGPKRDRVPMRGKAV